ncbi:HVO_0234 family beta-propeller protein [Natrialbaceae archaeon AArc-T1-2]|uniref:HVO_0234 family beta-propeller protein n=1 Tax=Natrialbaceae archaeon AArc-T1-2 TaxID=3053904 RepID=UPI00255A9183|nr:hypothetical protein [Natrialbaceae archaeon AArc-T1-2]WIV68309.1 hypothetical protein QQ977_06195 [Natrialbaceae archaeon AArc-T1-2]
MLSIEEKRVYDDRTGVTEAYVASGIGVCWVRISEEIVGEFGLVTRCSARDVAVTAEAVAVATDEDVLVFEDERVDSTTAGTAREDGTTAGTAREDGTTAGTAREDGTTAGTAREDGFTATGFGPAVAVGYDDSSLLAVAPSGRVARFRDGVWTDLESPADLAVRAIDRDLFATDDGIYRVHGGALVHAGLEAARDVSAPGVPLAATDDGLYKLGNGWMREREGRFDAVAADPRLEPGSLERAYAASGTTVLAHGEDAWEPLEATPEPVVDVGYGETVYAVTGSGTFLAAGQDGWRSRALGLTDVTGLAVSAPIDGV